MVAVVRAGASLRASARRFGVSLLTVQRWVGRAGTKPLEEVVWADRSSAPGAQAHHTPADVEDGILRLRRELRATSVLGEYGAVAIRRELFALGDAPSAVPSVRTIGRILDRRGALDRRGRQRRPAPPPGWYLPAVAGRRAELDLVDSIEGLHLQGGVDLEILTLISLHGGLPGAWPSGPFTAGAVIDALVEHWREHGLPGYAQFDNAMIFAGSHARPDLGRVGRLCLGLGIVPVFVPPREMGFQAAIESFNGRWQAKLWARFWSETLEQLQERSAAYVVAGRTRSAVRIEGAPERAPFPATWARERPVEPRGRVIYVRRTNDRGEVTFLRRRFPVDPLWPHRLVRAEVDLEARLVSFHALRRRDPDDQRLLLETPYVAPWPPGTVTWR